MKCQNDCYTILEDSDLTPVQQQLLKFISFRKTISVSPFNFFERRLAKKDVFPFLWGEPFIINVFILLVFNSFGNECIKILENPQGKRSESLYII